MKSQFLKVRNTSIVGEDGKPIALKGTNFGGWLMMEAYFMHAPNTAEQILKKRFLKELGPKALQEFENTFRRNFIMESDMKQIADWGFNSLRLPFNYKIIKDGGLTYLDQAIRWAKKYGVYLILDLHAAPGAQNNDWHSDSLGKAELWTKKSNRHQTYAILEFLGDRYKDETIVAGYDVLNEAVLDDHNLLNEFYREAIKAIRRSDKNHILFIEGTRWAQIIDVLDDFSDDNWLYSIHYYEPPEFTFHFVPFMKYPLKGYDKNTIRRRMEGYWRFAQKKKRPVHVGEFGVNYREGVYNEHEYLKDVLKAFNDFGFHWNYWTYKAVKNAQHPDGIYSYYPNDPWVARGASKTGWDTWASLWPKHKKGMAASWRTGKFTLNTNVYQQLIKAL